MFNRYIQRLADVTPVAANGRATFDIPRDGMYHTLFLECVDSTGAPVPVANILQDIGEITVKHDGTNVMQINSELIYKLYEYYYSRYNVTRIDGLLPLLFANEYFTDQAPADRTSVGFINTAAPQVEIEFGATVGTAGHTSNVRVRRDVRNISAGRGTYRKLLRYSRNQTSGGQYEIDDIPHVSSPNVGTIAHHIVYDGTAARINRVELLVNQTVILDVTPQIMKFIIEQAGRKWQDDAVANSIFTLPYDLSNDPTGYLVHGGITDLRIRVDWTAAPGQFDVYAETYDGIGSAEGNA
ncbi:MAG: hypothetical protein AAFW82_03210 [Pseudomonadota bacterium]